MALKLRVVTPRGVEFEEEVNSLIMPAADGEVELLPGHSSYATLVGVGIASFESVTTKHVTRFVVCGGFCTIAADVITLCPDSVDRLEEININNFSSEKSALQEKLRDIGPADTTWKVTNQKLSRIEAVNTLVRAGMH